MRSMVKICLNMIVKNENAIITRLLDSVYPFIDCYCICDTGSTDTTIDTIQCYFEKKGILGKIIQESFQDFGYNRTVALNACTDMDADYILLLDADMILRIDKDKIQELKKKLTLDAYCAYQGNSQCCYKNIRLVKNRQGATYWGVTHEYVNFVKVNNTIGIIPQTDFFIADIGDGGSKTDKISRDIRLLKKGLEDLPNNDRYTFYLANTYRDNGNDNEAIRYYTARIFLGGWIEEVWFSHYMIGILHKKHGRMQDAMSHWLDAYNKFPLRIENLYEIVRYYRENENYHLAYTFYRLADYERTHHPVHDFLFTSTDVYEYKLDYEMSMIGYHCNRDKYDMISMSMKLLANHYIEESHRILWNYKFYKKSLLSIRQEPSNKELHEYNLTVLHSIGKDHLPLLNENHMQSSTPSICYGKDKTELLVNVRFVNYRINEQGEYINRETIKTINILAIISIRSPKWIKVQESVLNYNTLYDNYYVGQEDVRLHRISDTQISYNANRCNLQGEIKVEHGNLTNSSCEQSFFIKKEGERTIEKNWILFEKNQCVYEWYPLTIGDIEKNKETLNVTHVHENMPHFFRNVRGSSNGITIKNEIWFICHVVNYEDRRRYYHLMVVLDKQTLQLVKYTSLWTFEDHNPVEYTLGMIFKENTFMIGYSVLDSCTKYMNVGKETMDAMMIFHEK